MNFPTTFAQTAYEASCTINGRVGTAEECSRAGGIALAILIPFGLIWLAFFILWITTLVHAIKHEDVPNRVIWIILHFFFLGLLAGPLYYFIVKRPYAKQHVGGATATPAAAPAPTAPAAQPVQPPQPPVATPEQPPQPPTPPAVQ